MIGVGITTRNRSDCLEQALKHFAHFGVGGDKIVIVDDDSDGVHGPENHRLVSEFARKVDAEVVFRRSGSRLGIARAKNACLGALLDCDDVFLFDDDAWPRSEGWAETWLRPVRHHRVGHTLWMSDVPGGGLGGPVRANIKKIRRLGSPPTALFAWNNCFGVMLHFTRECLDALGGYDASARNVYGFEHAQMSKRAKIAGFTKNYTHLSPWNAGDLVYSVDISLKWLGEPVPLTLGWEAPEGRGSVTPEEAAMHMLNASLMDTTEAYVPLDDPFA